MSIAKNPVDKQAGTKVLELRLKLGFSQAYLAITAGVSPTLLLNVERYGLVPTLKTRTKIANVLGIAEHKIWTNTIKEIR